MTEQGRQSAVQNLVDWALTRPGCTFWAFVCLHVAVWSLTAILVQPNLPLDVIEQLAWARDPQWVYFKHPPLVAWVLGAVDRITGGAAAAMHLVGPLATGLAFWALWRLATTVAGPQRGLIAVLLLEGVIYFNIATPEFNHNVIQLPLWSLIAYTAHRALRQGRSIDWLATGLLGALGLYAKYSTVLPLAALGLFILLNRQARRHLAGPGPYLGAGAGLLALAPQFWALHRIDYLPFHFPFERTAPATAWYQHLLFPLDFAGAQLLAIAGALLLIALLRAGRDRAATEATAIAPFDRAYVMAMGLGPFALTLAFSGLLGLDLQSMWGAPMWCLLGLVAMVLLPAGISAAALRRFAVAWLLVFALALAVFAGSKLAGPHLRDKGGRVHFPGAALAQEITTRWRQAYPDRRLDIVIGKHWIAGNVSFYSDARPSIMINGRQEISPWIDDRRLARHGAVIVWEVGSDDPTPEQILAPFPDAVIQAPFRLPWRVGAALPAIEFGWAILPPKP